MAVSYGALKQDHDSHDSIASLEMDDHSTLWNLGESSVDDNRIDKCGYPPCAQSLPKVNRTGIIPFKPVDRLGRTSWTGTCCVVLHVVVGVGVEWRQASLKDTSKKVSEMV
jgi:hypothetical protein